MVSCGGSGTLVTSGVGVVVTVPDTEVDTVSDGDVDNASPYSRRCRGRNANSDRARDVIAIEGPAVALAAVLSEILTDEDKTAVCRYLLAIAVADGELANEEKKLLDAVAAKLKIDAFASQLAQAA